MNPDNMIYLTTLAHEADDPVLRDLTGNLLKAEADLSKAEDGLFAARESHIRAKNAQEIAWAHAMVDSLQSNKEKRDADATLATEDTLNAVAEAEIAFRSAERDHEAAYRGWAVLRHILASRYGVQQPYGGM